MRRINEMSDGAIGCFAMTILLGGIIVCVVGCDVIMGVGGFGPERTVEATVQTKHVDAGKESSHYMVTTDQGVFEVDNGILLGVWNSDELYGRLEVGKRYRITTKGRKTTNIVMQEYPYITAVEVSK